MEIKCTQKEKEKLISVLEIMPTPCMFPRYGKTCWIAKDTNCRKCLETKIKWTITNK